MKSFFSDSSVDRSNSEEEDDISSMRKDHINFGDDESSSESESNESVIPCARNRIRRNEDNDGDVIAIEKISPDRGMKNGSKTLFVFMMYITFDRKCLIPAQLTKTHSSVKILFILTFTP